IQLETVLGSGRRAVPVSLGYTRSVQSTGQMVNQWLAQASVILPRVSLTAVVTDKQVTRGTMFDEGISVGLLANTRILGFMLRADAAYRVSGPQRGFADANLTIEKSLTERS